MAFGSDVIVVLPICLTGVCSDKLVLELDEQVGWVLFLCSTVVLGVHMSPPFVKLLS